MRWTIAALCALSFGLLLRAVAGRVGFQWPLEWMEGATIVHARRLLEGRALYGPPSADFIPNLYPPLSYVPVAASIAALGPSLWAARVPSLLCLVGSSLLIGMAAGRACGDRWAGVLAAAFWMLGYGYTGAFMDLARVDPLFILLLCAGMERTVSGHTLQGLGWFGLSCYAKQHGAIFLALGSVHAAWALPALRLRIAGVWGALGASFVVGQVATSGWLGFYTLELPAAHGAIPHLVLSFLLVDVALYLPLLCVAAAVGVIAHRRRPRAIDALLIAGLAAGALGRGHVGGFDNVRLPAYAVMCVAAAAQLWPWLTGPRARLVLSATVVQAAMLVQLPALHLPTASDAALFAGLRAAVRRCGGADAPTGVLAPDYAGVLGQGALHTMALSDLQLAAGPVARRASAELIAKLRSPDRPAVVVAGARFDAMSRALAEGYRVCERPAAPNFVTGYDPPRPTVYGAKPRAAAP